MLANNAAISVHIIVVVTFAAPAMAGFTICRKLTTGITRVQPYYWYRPCSWKLSRSIASKQPHHKGAYWPSGFLSTACRAPGDAAIFPVET